MAQTGSAKTSSRRPFSDQPDAGTSPRSADRPLLPQARVFATLRRLPSHGWTAGWTGRRDRALLVLSQLAGLSYESIAQLRVGDVDISDGNATIKTTGGTTKLHMDDDDLICGPCALARWIHALDLAALYPNTCVIAAVIARAAPLTADSPHLCQGTVTVTEATRQLPILPNTDQWGPYPIAKPLSGAVPVRTIRAAGPFGGTDGRMPAARSTPVGPLAGNNPASIPRPAGAQAGGAQAGDAQAGDAQTSDAGDAQSGRETVASRIPAQQGPAAWQTAVSPIIPIRSSYHEQSVTPIDGLADGLEGRARQLLDHPATDNSLKEPIAGAKVMSA
jgi:hypothetical protein